MSEKDTDFPARAGQTPAATEYPSGAAEKNGVWRQPVLLSAREPRFSRKTQNVKSKTVLNLTTINDIVLIHLDRKPSFYARINDINPDVKKGWYQVELLVLTLPPQTLVWILEEAHIQGEEFTMGGRPMKLVEIPRKYPPQPETPAPEGKGKVVPLRKL
jgi:hypothetical protein